MRRVVLIVLAVLVLTVAVWADNAKRIEALQARQKAIVVEINDRQVVIDTQTAAINDLRTEFVRNQGAIEELQRQDSQPQTKK
jgi:TolA-binding protein